MLRAAICSSLLIFAAAEPTSAATGKIENNQEQAAGDRDQQICKRFRQTGSLVRSYRTCKPKWEWERERENRQILSVADSCAVRGGGGTCG